jgi:hypothetical protein
MLGELRLNGVVIGFDLRCSVCGVGDWKHCYALHAAYELRKSVGIQCEIAMDCPCPRCVENDGFVTRLLAPVV